MELLVLQFRFEGLVWGRPNLQELTPLTGPGGLRKRNASGSQVRTLLYNATGNRGIKSRLMRVRLTVCPRFACPSPPLEYQLLRAGIKSFCISRTWYSWSRNIWSYFMFWSGLGMGKPICRNDEKVRLFLICPLPVGGRRKGKTFAKHYLYARHCV